MEPREQIVEQALSLTPEDRVYVADALELSLTPTGFATPEIAAEWATEIERRIADYDRGEVQASNLDTAVDRMRQHLAKYRAGKVSS